MLVDELLQNINFNDSCVIELLRLDEKVILKLDLCMWKQKAYNEGEPELKEVMLEFDNVKNYNWNSDKEQNDIDYDSIIDISYENSIVKIVLEDEVVSIITFECSNVQMN